MSLKHTMKTNSLFVVYQFNIYLIDFNQYYGIGIIVFFSLHYSKLFENLHQRKGLLFYINFLLFGLYFYVFIWYLH